MSQAKLNSLRATKAAMDNKRDAEKSQKTLKAAYQEVQDQKSREAAGRAYDKATGYKNGGMVKMTPKATAYKCGGMVKGK